MGRINKPQRPKACETGSHWSPNSVGAALSELRFRAGLTQQQIADMTGRSQSYVSSLEHGRTRAKYADVQDYARAVGMSVVEVCAFIESC